MKSLNKAFQKTVWDHYKKHRRGMPWRENITPYRIVVSEIMLQQTQVDRVAKKFSPFLQAFPNFKALANAPLSKVLKEWQGLGYNRRALNLQKLARAVCAEHGGELPRSAEALENLPGIGPNTAGSILAFAFNLPHPFIETNIRTVYIHHFFPKARAKVHDKKLLPIIAETLDAKNPREWHYALMDYGSFLKKTLANPSRKSVHHIRQSKFKGSNRELRSLILKHVLKRPSTLESIAQTLPDKAIPAIEKNLSDLVKEKFLIFKNSTYEII